MPTRTTSGRGPHGLARSRRRAVGILAPAALAVLCAAAAPAVGGEVSPALSARLGAAQAAERLPVVVTLAGSAPATSGRPVAVLRALRERAARSQGPLAARLDRPVRRFWLVNALATRATPAEIRWLAARSEVRSVSLDAPARLAATDAPAPSTGAEESWALQAVGAPDAWARGLTGAGQVVGSIDTGVDPATPRLAGKVAAWRDFIAGRPQPYDDSGHGTFTVAEMVGSGASDGSGVAPGARVVVAKAFDANGNASPSALLAAAQWMTDPDGNPATADYPTVINNSWGGADANETWFRPMVQAWLALGIVPVFSAGNTGPSPGSLTSPASLPEAVAVGAVDRDDAVAGFSARGPVLWENRDGVGPAMGTPLAKPDLVAPGVEVPGVRGSVSALGTGTSMAAPLVSGIVALMRQASPGLPAGEVAAALRRSARDLGAAGPDPDFGWGLVNATAAVDAAAPGAAAPSPHLTDVRAAATVSRKSGRLVIAGRVVGLAQVTAAVGRPRRAGSVPRTVLSRAAGPVAGRFRLALPVRRLPVGRYRLSLSTAAPGGGSQVGLSRTVRVVP